jgi:hypothetical protein
MIEIVRNVLARSNAKSRLALAQRHPDDFTDGKRVIHYSLLTQQYCWDVFITLGRRRKDESKREPSLVNSGARIPESGNIEAAPGSSTSTDAAHAVPSTGGGSAYAATGGADEGEPELCEQERERVRLRSNG